MNEPAGMRSGDGKDAGRQQQGREQCSLSSRIHLPVVDEMQQSHHCSQLVENFLKSDHAHNHKTARCFSLSTGTNGSVRTLIMG